ncbi:hypothetical protein [Celeribacter halophilus]|uniref:Antitoxin VapB n=1 Tax=Celeribacter halophilus TaxID=576117 RepID=A0A1I3RR89_9RHOB|nr:hypothetical protein [Celeribacter halophilus]PZX12730.1 antitoxin VapB [Celeribacter halophilus]SFJ48828.1 antitoxin VapB [Celeribacter halophilus]
MDDEVERLKSLLLRMADVNVSSDVYNDHLRAVLLRELYRLKVKEDLRKRLRSLQEQVGRMRPPDPDFDMKRFMDESWE